MAEAIDQASYGVGYNQGYFDACQEMHGEDGARLITTGAQMLAALRQAEGPLLENLRYLQAIQAAPLNISLADNALRLARAAIAKAS